MADFNVVDLDYLLTNPKRPIPWILEPWMAAGEIVCMAGEPKVGKSFLALDITIALATATKALGCIQVAGGPYRVLYIDEENNENLLRHRLQALIGGRGLVDSFPSSRICYALQSGTNLDARAWRLALAEKCEDFKPHVLVLDTLVRFHRRDENSNSQISAFYSEVLKPIRNRFGVAIMALHHFSKPVMGVPGQKAQRRVHRVRGAGDLIAQVDHPWTIEPAAHGLTVHHETGRWGDEIEPIRLSINDVDGGIRIEEIEQVESNAQKAVEAFLATRGPVGATRQEVIVHLGTNGFKSAPKAVTRAIGSLHAHDKLVRKKEAREVRYWLAEPPGTTRDIND